jgi:PTS system ascorbate-specific IIA component
MNVGIVVVTHGLIGKALIEVAEFVLEQSLNGIRFVSFSQSEAGNIDSDTIRSVIGDANTGDGVLVLTDLMGASPSNIVADLLSESHSVMVSGINLAMLIRVWNYREQPLESLAALAVEGGRRDVELCVP